MSSVINAIEAKYRKNHITDVKSGDTVRVHQKIREGNKERIQVFEGLVIRTDRKGSHTSSIAVRRIASGIGVEKTYLLHSPLVVKVEVTKRSKVRRNYLTYMRARTGKSARLASVDFDKNHVNAAPETIKTEVPEAEKSANVEESKEDSSKQTQSKPVATKEVTAKTSK